MDLWLIELDRQAPLYDLHQSWLSPEEHQAKDRLVRTDLRQRYVAAHGSLRCILAAYIGRRPPDIAFRRASGGKPVLAGSDGPMFNLSHSLDRALVAVSFGAPVGVDVEAVRQLDDWAGLAERCFAPEERKQLAALAPAERARGFMALWTCKEAYVKATGEGLARPLTSFAVELGAEEEAKLLRPAAEAGRFAVQPLDLGPRYVGAAAAPSRAVAWRSLPSLPG